MDMMNTIDEISSLSIDDRIRVVDAIWATIAAEPGELHLTDTEREEIDRRLAAHAANPQDVVPWETVKARAMARAQR